MKIDWGEAVFLSIVAGFMVFLMEWAGWRGKFEIWGDPQPLGEIWWHPLEFAAAVRRTGHSQDHS
jgi:hypothetical protein